MHVLKPRCNLRISANIWNYQAHVSIHPTDRVFWSFYSLTLISHHSWPPHFLLSRSLSYYPISTRKVRGPVKSGRDLPFLPSSSPRQIACADPSGAQFLSDTIRFVSRPDYFKYLKHIQVFICLIFQIQCECQSWFAKRSDSLVVLMLLWYLNKYKSEKIHPNPKSESNKNYSKSKYAKSAPPPTTSCFSEPISILSSRNANSRNNSL